MRVAIAIPLCAALAACGAFGPPMTPQGTAATVGDVGPPPINHGELFARYLAGTLKDPYSAQVSHIAGPAPWVKGGSWGSTASAYGWGACYAVNAKNSFGGYTGARLYVAVVRSGALVSVIGPSGSSNIFEDAAISNFCNSAGRPRTLK